MSDRLARLGVFEIATALWGGLAGCSGEEDDGKEHPLFTDSYTPSCKDLPPEETGLEINEVLFDPEGDDAGKEWVELFNKSPQPINIDGYTISDNDATILLTLPNVSIPACSYYVARLPNESLGNEQDTVALFNGEPSTDTIIDFLAYSAMGMIEEDHAFAMAKAAGIWSDGDFVDVAGLIGDPSFIRTVLSEGESIGRDRDSTDTDTPADWAPLGGVNSFGITPGAVNFSPITVAKPVWEIAAQDRTRPWTFLIYMAADSDLERWGFWDLNILERVGSTDNVNVAVMADFATRDLTPATPRVIDNSAYIHIQRDRADAEDDRLISQPQILREVNTGNPDTLANFLRWGVQTFPAEHYYLVIWGHGNGWKGTASDFFNRTANTVGNNDRLTMEELRTGLLAGPTIDVLSFYSCLMGGIEVAYQVQEGARYMVASEEVLRTNANGTWPWDTIIRRMDQNSAITAEDLARFTAQAANTALAGFNERTLSVINLTGQDFPDLITQVSGFADDLRQGLEDWGEKHDDPKDNVQTLIKGMLGGSSKVESFTYLSRGPFSGPAPDYRDLFHLAEKTEGERKIANRWKGRARNVREALGRVVVENLHGAGHGNAHGLSIYFPKAHTSQENRSLISADEVPFDTPLSETNTNRQLYAADNDLTAPANHPLPPATMRFTTDTHWDEFLHRYYNPVADASCHVAENVAVGGQSTCQAQSGGTVRLKAVGSSDSDGGLFSVNNREDFYWDFDATVSTDALDYDKDNNGAETDDDNDARGREVTFTCPEFVLDPDTSNSHQVRLMVWDDHYKVDGGSSGNHSEHFQVDDAFVDIICIEPQ